MEKGSALVQGEDSESDEEINTEHLTPSMETSLRRLATNAPQKKESFGKPGIVAGEGSETDEEEEEADGGVPSEPTDGTTLRVPPVGSRDVSGGSTPRSSRRSSGDSSAVPPPPSLLHKILREKNISLRKNIVERILRIYHATCRNLTVVNDNLSRNQATIEKVNSQLKKADQDLERVNTSMKLITEESCTFAPTLRMEIPQHWKSAVSKAAGPSSDQATTPPTQSSSQKRLLTSATKQTS